MKNSIVIYFKNGGTALFKNVSDINISSLTMCFNYFGESTQVTRKAKFNLTSIAGYAQSCIEEK